MISTGVLLTQLPQGDLEQQRRGICGPACLLAVDCQYGFLCLYFYCLAVQYISVVLPKILVALLFSVRYNQSLPCRNRVRKRSLNFHCFREPIAAPAYSLVRDRTSSLAWSPRLPTGQGHQMRLL